MTTTIVGVAIGVAGSGSAATFFTACPPQVTRSGASVIRSVPGNSNGVIPQQGVTYSPSGGHRWVAGGGFRPHGHPSTQQRGSGSS